ncbi:hypothetical protein K439DRAFT_1520333 [Ramaria rubella]|nr:hypothetical protein K439DRAFT_1520333 [Ramaria rubella]
MLHPNSEAYCEQRGWMRGGAGGMAIEWLVIERLAIERLRDWSGAGRMMGSGAEHAHVLNITSYHGSRLFTYPPGPTQHHERPRSVKVSVSVRPKEWERVVMAITIMITRSIRHDERESDGRRTNWRCCAGLGSNRGRFAIYGSDYDQDSRFTIFGVGMGHRDQVDGTARMHSIQILERWQTDPDPDVLVSPVRVSSRHLGATPFQLPYTLTPLVMAPASDSQTRSIITRQQAGTVMARSQSGVGCHGLVLVRDRNSYRLTVTLKPLPSCCQENIQPPPKSLSQLVARIILAMASQGGVELRLVGRRSNLT